MNKKNMIVTVGAVALAVIVIDDIRLRMQNRKQKVEEPQQEVEEPKTEEEKPVEEKKEDIPEAKETLDWGYVVTNEDEVPSDCTPYYVTYDTVEKYLNISNADETSAEAGDIMAIVDRDLKDSGVDVEMCWVVDKRTGDIYEVSFV